MFQASLVGKLLTRQKKRDLHKPNQIFKKRKRKKRTTGDELDFFKLLFLKLF
jgi:hypothetical protein